MDVDTLKKCKLFQLSAMVERLKFDINATSKHLVHILVEKDERTRKLCEMEERLTDILIQYASYNDLNIDIEFSLKLSQSSFDNYSKWLNGWKIVSRIGRGIPKQFRKRVWDCISTYTIQNVPVLWENTIFFDGKRSSRDIYWLEQINGTSYELNSKYVSHSSIEHVLLAYFRHNTNAEYIQELYILSSLLLKILEGEEQLAFKVLICLIDYKFRPAYFKQQSDTVHLELMVVNELLIHLFPQLTDHLTQLQTSDSSASSSLCKSYSLCSNSHLKDLASNKSSLTNAFVSHWFIVLFTNCLSWKSLRRLFDAVILCDANYFIYAGLAIWGIFEKDLLTLESISDYVVKFKELEGKLRNSQLLSSTSFMEMVYAVSDVVQKTTDIPTTNELRYKHTIPIPPPPAHIPSPLQSEEKPALINSFKEHTVSVDTPVLQAKAECPQTRKKKFFFANAHAADIPDSILAIYSMDTVKSHHYLLKNGKMYLNLM